ncbi:polysaccharide lyase family 7 protein [Sphingomonas sp. R86521]|uniref:polysaccharide lyase family 7 protein n=1 Tax=Sphingomonas sp. R86521 TaxID=3093860 RepID=UPI0036D21B1A
MTYPTYSVLRMTSIIVAVATSCSAAFAECSITIPTATSTASYGTLQLPVDANGDGKPDTVSGSQLPSYSSQFFERQTAARVVMRVPSSGLATTPNSKYPRSELKENRTWNVNDGCAAQAARVNIYDLPASGDIVIGQIHQEATTPRPPVELHYTNGTIHADVLQKNTTESGSPRTRLTIKTGIPTHQFFSYSITLEKGGLLRVTVNDKSQTTYLDSSFDNSKLYFKAGNYTQDTNGGSSVGFEGLSIKHN